MTSGETKKIAVIAGAGPAGLTAALELLRTTDIKPIIFEMDNIIGGISRTVNHNGNRMDIGGHRFFSKNDTIMSWWLDILPLETPNGPNPEKEDLVMLCRSRLSRILFLRKLFDYPISLNSDTIRNLGLWRMLKIGMSYLKVQLLPKRKEKSLEDFMINRFGGELYRTFFRDYTEKLWGVPCNKISPEWGGQRIKGLSVTKTVLHAIKQTFAKPTDIHQKDTETSLIKQFLYPKFGPGQLWETVAEKIKAMGGEIHMNARIVGLNRNRHGNHIENIIVEQKHEDGSISKSTHPCDYFLSTMPIKDLIAAISNERTPVPTEIKRISEGLVYRDFITVGLLLDQLEIGTTDNWIYVQESDVKLGRIQIFNNWSPYLVCNPSKIWIGLEYFVNEGDKMWTMPDADFIQFAINELDKIHVAKPQSVRDSVVFHIKKAYPAYFGTYNEFGKIRDFLDTIENLFPMGRNGMHKYNNMDHSMLTAMETVKCIREGSTDKRNLWNVNTEEDYHEKK